MRTAIETQDLTRLEDLYHPSALQISVSTGHIFKGREAIVDGFKRTFQNTGSETHKSTEHFMEMENIICVHTTTRTFAGDVQSYDVFVLQANKVAQHFTGLITPRPQTRRLQGVTRGEALHRSLEDTIEKQNMKALRGFYHPEATFIDSLYGQFYKGREAVLNYHKRNPQNLVRSKKIKSIESLVETEEIICVEAVTTAELGPQFGGASFDVLGYSVYMLQANQIIQEIDGLISPPLSDIEKSLQKKLEQQSKIQEQQFQLLMQRMEWERQLSDSVSRMLRNAGR